MLYPESPCTQIVYTLGPMYLYREYFKAKVYTIRVHGPLGIAAVGQGHLTRIRIQDWGRAQAVMSM